MDFFNALDVSISRETTTTYFYVSLTFLIAVLADYGLRSLIKVPKHFDTRKTRSVAVIIRNAITIFAYAIATYIALELLGINLTPLLASASVIGIVLGIGARSVIEDFMTGFFLLSAGSIAVGDHVQIGTTEGLIDYIGYRTLTIKAESGALHTIPNGQIKELINFSRNPASLMINIPVKGDQKIDKILESADSALKLLEKDEKISPNLLPGSKVQGIDDFITNGTLTMVIQIVIRAQPSKQWEAGRTYRYLIKKEFEKNKINLA